MRERCRQILYIVLLVVLLSSLDFSVTLAAETIEVKIPILITGEIPSRPEVPYRTYLTRDFTMHFQRGDEVWLSANDDGTGDIVVADFLIIKVIHPDGTIAEREYNFRPADCPLGIPAPLVPLLPQNVTGLFAVGENKIFVWLTAGCAGEKKSSRLSLVRSVIIFSFTEIFNEVERELGEIGAQLLEFRNSWEFNEILDKLQLCLNWLNEDCIRDVISKKEAINPRKLINVVKEKLPKLRSKIEVLIQAKEVGENRGKRVLSKLDELNRFLCGLDQSLDGCFNIEILTPITSQLDNIERQLGLANLLLEDSIDQLKKSNKDEAVKDVKRARKLLKSAFFEIKRMLAKIYTKLSSIEKNIIIAEMAAKRKKRSETEETSKFQSLAFAVAQMKFYPNPVVNVDNKTVIFKAEGIGIESIRVQIFDLSGKIAFDEQTSGGVTSLEFYALNSEGRRLANGIYLCVITVRGFNGEIMWSDARKLVILR